MRCSLRDVVNALSCRQNEHASSLTALRVLFYYLRVRVSRGNCVYLQLRRRSSAENQELMRFF
jgi:hypothetical protein